MPYHILGDEHRDVVFPIMNQKPNSVNTVTATRQMLSEKKQKRKTNKGVAYPTKFGRIVHDRALV